MAFTLDHVILSVRDLDAAIATLDAQGFNTRMGGEHLSGTTLNGLAVFQDGTYLELLASTGREAKAGATDFSPLLADGEGWAGYALLSDDLAVAAEAIRARGVEVGEAQPGSRQRPDGTLVRWQLATLDNGFSPFLIEDETPRALRVPDEGAVMQHANGITGIRDITFVVHNLGEGIARYQQLLGELPRIHGNTAVFTLGGTTLTLIGDEHEDRRAHFQRRPQTPYRITFAVASPHKLPPECELFGAKMAFAR